MARLRQIADECGLSINAVSEILNRGNQSRYRPDTCARVLEVAQRLNYVPNRVAQAMRSRRSRVVGFVTESTSTTGDAIYHTSLYSFIVGLSHALIAAGHHLAVLDLFELAPVPGDPRARMLDEVFFDGLVVHQGRFGAAQDLERRVGVPVIWYDAQVPASERHIRRDELQAGRALVAGLVAQGHRRIAAVMERAMAVTAPDFAGYHYSLHDRQAGFAQAMREQGLEPLVIPTMEPSLVAEAIVRHDLTAVVSQGTAEFLPLMLAAQLAGRSVPRDLSLAAFDVDTRRDHGGLQVGGVLYDRYAAGQQCAAALLRVLRDPLDAPPIVCFPGVFTPGATVARQ